MSKPVLSKSTFVRSLQCLKSLYLYKNYFKQRDKITPAQQAIFARGNQIGVLAQQLFPGGFNASTGIKVRSKEALLKTMEAIQQGQKTIYEASFQFEEVWVIADIIMLKDDGWHIYEVKSSLSISETYLHDAALQYYIISNALPQIQKAPVQSISLVHVNAQYEKQGALNLQQFFASTDVTQHCFAQTDWIRQKLIKAKLTLEYGKIPAIDIGEHCKLPYPCDFTNTCHRHIAKPFDLTLPTDFNLEPTAKQMVLCMLSTKPAIPIYNGCKPYQPIPFAFAAKSTDSRFVHQFTGNNYENPTYHFIEKLYNILDDADVIWVDEILITTQLFQYFNQLAHANHNWELMIEKLAGIDTFFTSNNYFDINAAAKQLQVTVPVNTKVPHAIAATEIYLTMLQSQDLFSAAEQAEHIQQYLSDQLQLVSQMANTLGRFTNSNYV